MELQLSFLMKRCRVACQMQAGPFLRWMREGGSWGPWRGMFELKHSAGFLIFRLVWPMPPWGLMLMKRICTPQIIKKRHCAMAFCVSWAFLTVKVHQCFLFWCWIYSDTTKEIVFEFEMNVMMWKTINRLTCFCLSLLAAHKNTEFKQCSPIHEQKTHRGL